jgi:uncharacterized protein
MDAPLSKEEQKRFVELQYIALDFARHGEDEQLEKMLQAGLNPNTTDPKGNTLLMLAAYNGNLSTSKLLLEYKADPNRSNDHGHSILAGVAFKGYLDICKLLVEHGAKIEEGFSKSPIVFASLFGRKDIVNYLQTLQNKQTLKDKLLMKLASFFSLFRKSSD